MSFLLGPFRRSPAKRTSVNSHPLSSPSASRSRISPGGYFTGVAFSIARPRRMASVAAPRRLVRWEETARRKPAACRSQRQAEDSGGPVSVPASPCAPRLPRHSSWRATGPGQARARTALVGGPGPTGPQRRDGAAKPCHNRPASRPERRAPGGRSARNMFPPQLHAYLARGRAHREPPSRVHENRSAVCPRRPPSPRRTPHRIPKTPPPSPQDE